MATLHEVFTAKPSIIVEVLQQYILQFNPAQGNLSDDLSYIKNNTKGLTFECLFVWKKTPQGQNFWNHISKLEFDKAKKIYDWETVGTIVKEFTDNF